MIVGDRTYVELPGTATHELPPLLLSGSHVPANMHKVLSVATEIITQEDMVEAAPQGILMLPEERERRQMDLALNLVDQYVHLKSEWCWGDSILQWIRQCETVFGEMQQLRTLLRTDVWPHAGRASFVTLLEDKAISHEGINLECAVGLRLAFRQLPPIRCCSDQFLLYLNTSLCASAYHTWSDLGVEHASLPPERFCFQVVNTDLAF